MFCHPGFCYCFTALLVKQNKTRLFFSKNTANDVLILLTNYSSIFLSNQELFCKKWVFIKLKSLEFLRTNSTTSLFWFCLFPEKWVLATIRTSKSVKGDILPGRDRKQSRWVVDTRGDRQHTKTHWHIPAQTCNTNASAKSSASCPDSPEQSRDPSKNNWK